MRAPGATYRRFTSEDGNHVHPASILTMLALEALRYPNPPNSTKGRRNLVWTALMNGEGA